MTIGFITGGRQKGTANKRTQEIQELLEQLDCSSFQFADPFEA
jgi:hypothetical protein